MSSAVYPASPPGAVLPPPDAELRHRGGAHSDSRSAHQKDHQEAQPHAAHSAAQAAPVAAVHQPAIQARAHVRVRWLWPAVVLVLVVLVVVSVWCHVRVLEPSERTASRTGDIVTESLCNVIGPNSIVCTMGGICPLSLAVCRRGRQGRVDNEPAAEPSAYLSDHMKMQPSLVHRPLPSMYNVLVVAEAATYQNRLSSVLDKMRIKQKEVDPAFHRGVSKLDLELRDFRATGAKLQDSYSTTRTTINGALLKVTGALSSAKTLFDNIEKQLQAQATPTDQSWSDWWSGRHRRASKASLHLSSDFPLDRECGYLEEELRDAEDALSRSVAALTSSAEKTSVYTTQVADVTTAVREVTKAGNTAVDRAQDQKHGVAGVAGNFAAGAAFGGAFGGPVGAAVGGLLMMLGTSHHNSEQEQMRLLFEPLAGHGELLSAELSQHGTMMHDMHQYLRNLHKLFEHTSDLMRKFMRVVNDRHMVNRVDLRFIRAKTTEMHKHISEIRAQLTMAPVDKHAQPRITK